VKSAQANCGVFNTCVDVTVRNDGDGTGPATCSLVQYERGSNRQLVAGDRVRSESVAPGGTTVLTLGIQPKPVTEHRTRPMPYCEPYGTNGLIRDSLLTAPRLPALDRDELLEEHRL
jgi:hypothetical protein